MFDQQGVSRRMSTQINALENTKNEFKQQLSEVLHTSQTNQQSLQQNTLVLNNVSSMFSIMMEKIGNPGVVYDPKSPTGQNTNSHMPSLDPMLNSDPGSVGDTPHRKGFEVLRTEDATDMAKLKKKGVMRGGRSPGGASKIGVSKVGGTMRNGSPEGAVTEGGTLGGGNGVAPVGEPTPKVVGIGEGRGILVHKAKEVGVR